MPQFLTDLQLTKSNVQLTNCFVFFVMFQHISTNAAVLWMTTVRQMTAIWNVILTLLSVRVRQTGYTMHNTTNVCWVSRYFCAVISQHKKASNHHANLPLEMYSFTL